jgi:hypothetical protein
MRKLLFFTCLLLIIAVSYLTSLDQIYAQNNTDSVNATIKIGVCGDGEVEGDEQCDGVNLNSKTCGGLNYASGILTCDKSCSFNTTECLLVSPTATPVPTTSNSTNPVVTITTGPIQTIQRLIDPLIFRESELLLPQLEVFDSDQDGVINASEVFLAIKRWLGEWQLVRTNEQNKKCDINNDTVCDLRDLSVLLYYVDRQTQ